MMEVSQKSIAVVQSRNDKRLDKKLCSMLCKEEPDLIRSLRDRQVKFRFHSEMYSYNNHSEIQI